MIGDELRTLVLAGKKTWMLAMCLLTVTCMIGQDCAEFEQHSRSIDSTFYTGYVIDDFDSVFNANRAFVDYTIKHLLDKPTDQCFISNRNILRKLEVVACDSTNVQVSDTLRDGVSCNVVLTTGKFDPFEHRITANEDSTSIESIDGQYPYGGEYGLPSLKIKEIRMEVDGSELSIPAEAYGNLFEPNMCDSYGFERPIEVYGSLNGQYIYLYVYGGNAAGTYFAKLVFDRSKYLTRIISDYWPLSIHHSFRDDFLGF